jgi:hypothetical protein
MDRGNGVRAGRVRLFILKFGRRAAELQGSKISTGVEIPVEESGRPRNGERHDVPSRGSQQSKVGRPACAGDPPDYILPKASSSRGIYRAYLAGRLFTAPGRVMAYTGKNVVLLRMSRLASTPRP